MNKLIISIVILLTSFVAFSQDDISPKAQKVDYLKPKIYEIGGVTFSGVKYLDQNVLLYLTELEVGKKISIPGEDITQAIKKLWDQGLFLDVKITLTKTVNNVAFLDIYVEERPRLSRYFFKGIKKSEADDIREKIKLVKGTQITENTIMTSEQRIKDYFIDKGYYNVEVNIEQNPDTILVNSVSLVFDINKNKKKKVKEIYFSGNDLLGKDKSWYNKYKDEKELSDRRLRRAMKETTRRRWYNFFKSSKLVASDFVEDKGKIIERYNEYGFRDARIISDSVVVHEKNLDLYINVEEGKKYYFRNITWLGNTMYSSEVLSLVLGIESGDVYNSKLLDEKLLYDPSGVMSLYQDNGYLFSNIMPVEVLVENDSIDFEMRVYEGKKAVVNKVSVVGNTRTNDHVIYRELRTRPGGMYKRSDVQRTIRELAQLGYFDPEKLNVDFQPNPAEGTVDLEYIVQEKPSDQIELSGGYGAQMFVGTLGLAFNNFSIQNIFNGKAYRPLPAGDGQRLAIRASASGMMFQNYSLSFVEPWFGGKKPNSFTASIFHSHQSNKGMRGIFFGHNPYGGYNEKDQKENISYFKVSGIALGLGQRLRVPDDYFTLYNELSYRVYRSKNFHLRSMYDEGVSHNFSFKTVFGRHSAGPNPVYPTMGSTFSFSIELTPPYSLLNGKDYTRKDMPGKERYKWIEYHKYKLSGQWFTTLAGAKDGSSRALVLMTKFEFGLLGMYNKKLGASPFEGFMVGGDGLSGMNVYGSEVVSLRGYGEHEFTPSGAGNIYDKFTVELRYPISLSPAATFYLLGFVEAGNAWYKLDNVSPFDVRRSAGGGVRVFLQAIGMLGVDWGYGFDPIPGGQGKKSHFHFVIGQQF